MPYKDRETQRRYERERLARIRAAWLAAHGPCVRCGSTVDLEVDHVDPSQKLDHRLWSWQDRDARPSWPSAKSFACCATATRRAKNDGAGFSMGLNRVTGTWVVGNLAVLDRTLIESAHGVLVNVRQRWGDRAVPTRHFWIHNPACSATTPRSPWCTRKASLPRPSACKAGALLTELRVRGAADRNRTCVKPA